MTATASAENASIDQAVVSAAPAALPRCGQSSFSRRVAIDVVAFAEAGVFLSCYCLILSAFPPTAQDAAGSIARAQFGLVACAILATSLRVCGFYGVEAIGRLPCNGLRILSAVLAACCGVVGFGLPLPVDKPALASFLLLWVALSFAGVMATRLVASQMLARMSAASLFDTRVAVFGSGAIARSVRDHIQHADQRMTYAGLFDDRAERGRIDAGGLHISGSLDDLVALGLADGVDQIIIALPASASARIEQVARRLEQLPVSLHVVTHIASDLIGSGPAHDVSALGPIGLLEVKHRPLSDWSPIVKRAFDIVVAGTLTLLALPLFVIIALAVKLEDGGPVLFVQRRRGLNQRTIQVLKFRSMRVMQDGPVVPQAMCQDPRVTRVGRILRRSNLDELPQLINVLRGDMSLVGPRPHALAHDLYYGGLLEGYVNRHQVKPGITGLAQVRGLRGETRTSDKMQSRVDADMEYISSWSPWLDIKILVSTVATVVRGGNAH